MNEQIEAIRNEIKRLEEIHERNLKKPMERGRIGYAHGVVACCDRILSFIDSLPEFNRPKLSDNLDEAARLCAIPHYMKDIDVHHIEEYPYDTGLEAAFVAGAQWQKEQPEKGLTEAIAAAYQLGIRDARERLEHSAVDGEVVQDMQGVNRVKTFGEIPEWLHFGDKVRIIVIKEDER